MITTYTGKFVKPLELRPEDICVEDIAHSLALINRFVGHTRVPLPVAQHCVIGARMLAHTPHAKQFLFHDSSEAYLGDVSRWVKLSPQMAAYREAEDRVQRLVYRVMGLPEEQHPEVTRIDNLLVRLEGKLGVNNWDYHILQLNNPNYQLPTVEDHEEWVSHGGGEEWSWARAEFEFLRTYKMLQAREEAENGLARTP
jgi:hypothetical protein